jgi:hypothetical protein
MVGFVEVAEYIAYAAEGGVDLSATPVADLTAQLTQAVRLIDSVDGQLKGKRIDREQPHAYPRRDLTLQGFDWSGVPGAGIPLVKQTQMAFALEVNGGIDIFGAKTEQSVVREKVGSLEVQYSTPKEGTTTERESHAMFLLRQLMDTAAIGEGGVGFLEVVRT